VRLPALFLLAVATSACSGDSNPAPTVPTVPDAPAPPTPSGPSSSVAFLWGMVIERSGVCIVGASVRVLDGQRAGESMTQETPCDAWGYSGGFGWDSLKAGIPMTLRLSAPGYVDLDTTVTPTAGPQQAFLFEPSRAPGH
jgi:hypothetical protein